MLTASVVITCYNLERYIGDAITSVLRQRYAGPVEIIVVDDCSTDRSREIVAGFREVVSIQTPQNGGVLLATVLGMKRSTGNIILFLDGDDLWSEDKLATCMARYDADPGLSLLTHDVRFIDGAGAARRKRSIIPEAFAGYAGAESDFVREGILMLTDHVWLGSAYSIRCAGLDLPGFERWVSSLPDPRNTYQDWPLAYWAATRAGVSMGYVAEPLLAYRIHGSNHSGDASTPAKALRNWRRALNTNLAIAELARGTPAATTVQRRVAYDRLMVRLHGGDGGHVVKLAWQALPWLARQGLLGKEAIRLAGMTILGSARFAALTAALRRRTGVTEISA